MVTASNERPRVVVIGAGFGGLWAVRALSKSGADVLIIDRNNYHTFLPLLYQVAAAEVEPEEIAYPVRTILRNQPRTRFLMSEVTEIDLIGRVVKTARLDVSYDYLILAAGTVSHFFNVPGAAEHAFQLKTLDQGVNLRNHILRCFEKAIVDTDEERRRRALTFIIVGAGATGVEFAGALSELIRGPFTKDYRSLDFRNAKVVLLEAGDTVLSSMAECCRDYALTRMRGMGVEVHLKSAVSKVTDEAVHLADGTVLPTETVVWTAGVSADPLFAGWGLATASGGLVSVLPTLQVPDHPEVYAIGDLAAVEQDGRPLPMIAPVAIQQGTAAARNIMRQMAGRPAEPFRYHDRGTMVTIGRGKAVAHLMGRCFSGFPAWFLWLCVHLVNLIGFRNRLLVLINWAWDYFLFERAVRLILPSKGND